LMSVYEPSRGKRIIARVRMGPRRKRGRLGVSLARRRRLPRRTAQTHKAGDSLVWRPNISVYSEARRASTREKLFRL
jgi:hypothetical protein